MRFRWRVCYRDGSTLSGWTPGELGAPTVRDWDRPNMVRLEVYSRHGLALAIDIPPGHYVFCRMRTHLTMSLGQAGQYGVVALQGPGAAPDVWFLVDGKAEYQHGYGGPGAWAVALEPWDVPCNTLSLVGA